MWAREVRRNDGTSSELQAEIEPKNDGFSRNESGLSVSEQPASILARIFGCTRVTIASAG